MSICYHKGCGKTFQESENSEDACQFHPGGPIFHDAYKGWSCCKKRSTDFTEFLNIPGCNRGKHNPEKPKEPEKPVDKPMEIGEVITDGAPKMMKQRIPNSVVERPSDDIPKEKLRSTIAQSLKSALQKAKDRLIQESSNRDSNDDSIQQGAPCKNNACEIRYQGEDGSHGECNYHPGGPVFHEGYKFWSCCKKRTSDFNEFLKQSGCEFGQHVWMKPSEIAEKKTVCRYDWHQTSSNVVISVFAKCCDPEKCHVEANPTQVKASFAFNGGVNFFEIDLTLNGVIVPGQSSVEYLGTKAEIKLRKKEGFSWSGLEYTDSSS